MRTGVGSPKGVASNALMFACHNLDHFSSIVGPIAIARECRLAVAATIVEQVLQRSVCSYCTVCSITAPSI